MRITLSIKRNRTAETPALIDSGAGGIFIDEAFARKHRIQLTRLLLPLPVFNVDGTPNHRGHITHFVWLDIEVAGAVVPTRFLATSLGRETMILGLPWLRRINPVIDWDKGTLRMPDTLRSHPPRIRSTLIKPTPIYPKASVTELTEAEDTVHKHEDAEWLLPEFIQETQPNDQRLPDQSPSESSEPPEPPLHEFEPTDLVISYIKGESVIGIFSPPDEAPLTDEELLTPPTMTQHIGRTTSWGQSSHSLKYSYGQHTWIRAKINPSMELAQKAHAKEKSRSLEEMIPEPYREYKAVFEKKASERFPEPRSYDHAIDLKPDFVPRNCKIYPLSPKEQLAMDEFLEENLRKGYIRPSKSPMASPFFFVSKKDGTLRPCQDYRYLNEGTVKNAYPLPLIGELVDRLKGATVFSKFDLRSGYNNVRIKDGHQWKAAFKCSKGLFEPTVMFFGLCNSPATFQAMMNDLFKDMLDEGWLVIYMDDLLIFSMDLPTHQERTRRILQRLRESDLFLKPEKCHFDVTEVEFLGMIIRPDHVAMDPAKLDGIRDWPTPTSVKGVRSFLGFGNFYRRFISHYSDLAHPLNDLTRKDQPWIWNTEHQTAFDTLKQRFAESPVLLMPDKSKPFSVESDASKFATGAVLRQKDINGDWHPCAYLSKSFDAAQRNYEIYDRELLGVVRALEEWRHYLEGSPHPVEVLSDHKNLTFFRTAQKLNRRQARWGLFLSQFELQLRHIPGTRMIQSDTLSRLNHLNLEDNDNDALILLPDAMFVNAIDSSLADRLRAVTATDLVVVEALEAIKTKGPLPMRSNLSDWILEDGLVFFQKRCYVPPNEQLRRDIVSRYHDSLSMGHPGQFGTLALVRRDFWWPGLPTFVKSYVHGCAICQQTKINTHPTVPPLMPIPADKNVHPFEVISMDFITDLPPSGDFDSLMVVADHDSTKGMILIPCTKTIDALGTAELILNFVYKRFGLSRRIISDRGPQFAAKVFQELTRLLGIKSTMSTAYHPQTDGGTERMNQEVEAYLRAYCANHPEEWSSHLTTMEFAHNQRPAQGRNESPFFLMMGYNPRAIPTVYPTTDVPAAEERLAELAKARDEAAAAHELARQKMAERITRGFKPFSKGQKVWLEAKNLRFITDHKKLAAKRQGPFPITEVLGPLTYRLKLPPQWRIHPVFHATLLTPYHENDVHGPNFPQPPADVVDGQEEFEVEAIIAHKRYRGKMKYLVKWKGYPTADNTWTPEMDLKNARKILTPYKKLHRL